MSDSEQPVIVIVRRRAEHDEASHGGAWKIAFADFMTAMMSLFLVLWLISSTSEKTKHALAQYFNPVKLVDMTTLKKGFHDPKDTEMGSGPSARSSPPATDATRPGAAPSDAMRADQQTQSESALFRDPYAALSDIAARAREDRSRPEPGAAQSPAAAGAESLETFSDPFTTVPNVSEPDGQAPAPAEAGEPSSPAAKAGGARRDVSAPAISVPAPAPRAKPLSRPAAARREARRDAGESQQSEAAQIKSDISDAMKQDGRGQNSPSVDVRSSDEGILISMMDDANYTMFAVGSAAPRAKTLEAMEKIARLLKTHDGTIVIRGHTDGRPYKSPSYDNWRLSTARAHMAHYMLTRGGLEERRIERIEGYGDRRLKNPGDPDAAENRRIEILLRKEKP